MSFKDHFSNVSDLYSIYRPLYPDRLFEFLTTLVSDRKLVWDVGTGNGQAAIGLAKYFERVFATDASQKQIERAKPDPRVTYQVSPADKVDLPDASVDLVTCAASIHWFPFETFFPEVKRVLKPNAPIAIWCYMDSCIDERLDPLIDTLTNEVLNSYWPKERNYVLERYLTIPFPFQEVSVEYPIDFCQMWDFQEFKGYIDSWSATQRFVYDRGHHPLKGLEQAFHQAWGDLSRKKLVTWELAIRVGRNT